MGSSIPGRIPLDLDAWRERWSLYERAALLFWPGGVALLVAQVIGAAGGYRWAYWTLAAVMTLVSLGFVPGHPRPGVIPSPARMPGIFLRAPPPGC